MQRKITKRKVKEIKEKGKGQLQRERQRKITKRKAKGNYKEKCK